MAHQNEEQMSRKQVIYPKCLQLVGKTLLSECSDHGNYNDENASVGIASPFSGYSNDLTVGNYRTVLDNRIISTL